MPSYLPALTDGVHVRAGDQKRCVGRAARVAADDVAQCVNVRGEASGAHPRRDRVGGAPMLRREVSAREDFRILADRAKRFALLEDGGAEVHGVRRCRASVAEARI